jgi:hypothetical protein
MPRRLAACEACRAAKVACDRSKPQCSRCKEESPETRCIYRERPFKRSKVAAPTTQLIATRHDDSSPADRHRITKPPYPNPGYLGGSSSDTIFRQLESTLHDPSSIIPTSVVEASEPLVDEGLFHRSLHFIERARTTLDLDASCSLISRWLESGYTLALAAPFVAACTEASAKALGNNAISNTQLCNELFTNSVNGNLTEFDDVLEGNAVTWGSVRWETLGLFFAALSRASNDMQIFDSSSQTRDERRRTMKLALSLSDDCLDAVISLDCLNDIQLVLQYENFISHAVADGDQSKAV